MVPVVIARVCIKCNAPISPSQTSPTCFRCAFDNQRRSSARLAWWTEYGLRAWLLLLVALIVGRAFEYYRTPWLVVLAPIWMPTAWLLFSIVQLFLRFVVWLALRALFPWGNW